jgi:hypothetical protein
MRDLVEVRITADVPIRSKALPFADRLEIRLGKAFPVVLIIDRAALEDFGDAINNGWMELDAAADRRRNLEG